MQRININSFKIIDSLMILNPNFHNIKPKKTLIFKHYKMKTKTLLLLVIVIFSKNLSAQEPRISPENNPFDSKLIKSETTNMVWFMVQDTLKVELGKVKTEIQKKGNDLYVITTVDMKQAPMKWVDSTIAKISNLKPIYHASYNMQRDMVLRFSEQVTGYYFEKKTNTKTPISETIIEPYFDSNIYPQLIRWLPLKENYSTIISIFDYNPKAKIGVITATIKNTIDTDINFMGENRRVWKVETTDEISNNSTITTYYIDMKTRKVLKQEIDLGGRKMLMELIK